MKIYPEELAAYEKYKTEASFSYYCHEQEKQIKALIKEHSGWHIKHPYLHNLIGLILLSGLISLDLYLLFFIPMNGEVTLLQNVTLMIGHGIVMYNIIGYTLHEGAYHRMIILERGVCTRFLSFVAMNVCRFWYCDPVYYRQNHSGHHAHLGTQKDGTFTNFLHPKRFFISLGPLASALNYNDYKLHTGEEWTKSKILSESLSFGLVILISLPLVWQSNFHALLQYGGVIFIGAWISFALDRIRETTEHNLMPNDSLHGARDFGINFSGLFFGGGPWGQPCHLTHHIAPGLPWYQQLRFHLKLKKIMTPEQRVQFSIHPIWGVPLLLKKVLSQNSKYIKEITNE